MLPALTRKRIPYRLAEIIEKFCPGAHGTAKGSSRISQGEIDEKHCRGCRLAVPVSFLHASDGAVNHVNQEVILSWLLTNTVSWSVQDRPYVEPALDRWLVSIYVSVQNQRGHRRAMITFSEDAHGFKVVRVVDIKPAAQQLVVLDRYAVE